MKKIMIDMDDVICTDGILKLINKFLNTNYVENDLKVKYKDDLIPKDRQEEWRYIF